MNGRMYDPSVAQFLSPDPYLQAPENWYNYNRYAYGMNNPLIYSDPSGEWIEAIVMAIMIYQGGLQANFLNTAEVGDNPFNPGNWNWKNPNTYIGMAGGATNGANMVGFNIPTFNIAGVIPNGLLHAGLQVTFNGIGNISQNQDFFHNWYIPAIYGFATGAYAGYNISDERGLNYWWGNNVEYGRTQWSFFTSEKPYETIKWNIKNVGSLSLNDCVPTSFAEADDYFGGNTSYEKYKGITNYQEGVGVELTKNPNTYRELLSKKFNVLEMKSGGLSYPNWVKEQIIDNGFLINANWKYDGLGNRHSDVLRSIKFYHSGKVVMNFRIGSYRLSTVDKDWWFFIIKGLK
jgi:hypothetical protein